MVKESFRKLRKSTFFGILLLCGCSGAPPVPQSPPKNEPTFKFDLSSPQVQPKQLWSQRVSGSMTDLAVSRKGKAVLVATAPDRDVDVPSNKPLLFRFDGAGKLDWEQTLSARVKGISVSEDGQLGVMSHYEDQIVGMDRQGRKKWSIEGLCQPIVIDRSHKILCYHDDDSEPGVAFDVLDWKGKKILSYEINRDILSMRVSQDQRNTVIALNQGQVLLFDPEFRSKWQKKVSGEIVDVSVSSGKEPRIAVVFDPSLNSTVAGQNIAVFDHTGELKAQTTSHAHVEKVEISPNGEALVVYGNSPRGQHLGFYPLPKKWDASFEFKEKWDQRDSGYADYSSNLAVTQDLIAIGYEDFSSGVRKSHLVGFDFSGRLRWDVPLKMEASSYLYAHVLTQDGSTLIVGTDDGRVSAFRMK